MVIDGVHSFLTQLWLICLEASPWLLLGMLVASVIKVFIPAKWMARILDGKGIWPVVKAAIIGTPLPLCSCSVIPAAVALRRSGVSKASTVSFLVSTPENGADSIALTYALLGPFMTIARPVAAIGSALVAGILTLFTDRNSKGLPASVPTNPGASVGHQPKAQASSCASSSCCSSPPAEPDQTGHPGGWAKAKAALRYACDELFGDIAVWLGVGLVLAAVMNALVPPDAMAKWGSGLLPMLAVMLVGVPMYICATASTPVAAAMLLAGVSPGTVLVFLLAGPATNLATIGIVHRELGWSATWAYLVGVCGTALVAGLATDALLRSTGWVVDPAAVIGHDGLVPQWLAIGSFAVLALLTGRVIVKAIGNRLTADSATKAAACCDTP